MEVHLSDRNVLAELARYVSRLEAGAFSSPLEQVLHEALLDRDVSVAFISFTVYSSGVATTTEIRPGSVEESELALIEAALVRSKGSTAQMVGSDGARFEMPQKLAEALRVIVEHLRAGNGVSVSSVQAELTTTEAAQLLGVSRPHVVKLLKAENMSYRLVGTHRRIRLVDVLNYRDRQDKQARRALDELTRQAEELDLYD